ncbi:unnamed protein product [Ambrosiozyma monospora]|uniref:Unnamed protein product n=1 Tax=Ambrosiozyma monospora TaxID=43982 RepID=A0ACB5T0G7_AMBMO|nr:unnamed protein product [Ambrosiozyma monospora]
MEVVQSNTNTHSQQQEPPPQQSMVYVIESLKYALNSNKYAVSRKSSQRFNNKSTTTFQSSTVSDSSDNGRTLSTSNSSSDLSSQDDSMSVTSNSTNSSVRCLPDAASQYRPFLDDCAIFSDEEDDLDHWDIYDYEAQAQSQAQVQTEAHTKTATAVHFVGSSVLRRSRPTRVTDGCHPLAFTGNTTAAITSTNTRKSKKQKKPVSPLNSLANPFSNLMKKTSDSLSLATTAIQTSTIALKNMTIPATTSADHFDFKEFSTFSPCIKKSDLPDVQLLTLKKHFTIPPEPSRPKKHPLYASIYEFFNTATSDPSFPDDMKHRQRKVHSTKWMKMATMDNNFYPSQYPTLTPDSINRFYIAYKEHAKFDSIHDFVNYIRMTRYDNKANFDEFCDVLEFGLLLKERVWYDFYRLERRNNLGNDVYVDRYGRAVGEHLPWCSIDNWYERDPMFKPHGTLKNGAQYTVKGWSNKRWVGKTAEQYKCESVLKFHN